MSKGIRVKAEIKGLEELAKFVKELPKRVPKKANKAAVNVGATPIVKTARRLAPTESNLLKRSITKKVKSYSSGNAVAIIGANKANVGSFKGKKRVPANYWHLVIGGTKPHTITPTKGRFAGRAIEHPGAKPNDFFPQAIESSKSATAKAMRDKYAEVVDKEARKLAKGGT